ncbi:MAG TPA: tRNA uridine-5-carboxymethylaminomethyl(34) synthesis GTPase MnmE [candidate division Zixibacteria bacterium]|nr:tRNA uridine-5-carboxymethylaminomethyl(34) synthesis GTPase MnmE [candidate division Zixibacteria bacterium]
MHLDDTIVAIATPPGRGGIGIVRLSGPQAVEIAQRMLFVARTKVDDEVSGRAVTLSAGRAIFCELRESAEGERLDEVVVTYFAKPHSYTTDDVVEISCHGAPVILQRAVELALEHGARMAEPGEFTMRAFLNGRIDLTQAEAVRDLIDSQTLYQAKVAAQQLQGSLSHRVQDPKQKLVELIAILEAGIDFAEDDVAVIPGPEITRRIAELREPIEKLAASFQYGKLVHQGLTLAIVGRPNVGKSSLFNQLVQSERAIVTATPGTTRDLVTESVAIGGIPIRLVDTAGLRQALDEAENIGIRKSMEALADADLVLLVLDASVPLDDVDHELLRDVNDRAAIVVLNKADLAKLAHLPPHFSFQAANALADGDLSSGKDRQFITASSETPVVLASALTGEGISKLREEILRHVHGAGGASAEPGFVTNVRQHEQLRKALSALDAAHAAVAMNTPHEMLLLDLYSALRALDELTGATTADDILNLIFGTFCIGK